MREGMVRGRHGRREFYLVRRGDVGDAIVVGVGRAGWGELVGESFASLARESWLGESWLGCVKGTEAA